MTHYHGTFGHDHPGGDGPHDHPPAPEPPPRGNGGWLGAACVLAVIGAVVFFLLGRDYAGSNRSWCSPTRRTTRRAGPPRSCTSRAS
jgi:hypothetical protein